MKCKKCGCLVSKKEELDSQGLCADCTQDLSFKAKSHIIPLKEAEKSQKENKFWNNIENNDNEFDFIIISTSIIITAAIYFFYSKKELAILYRLSFFGAFLRIFLSMLLFCTIFIIGIELGMILLKPLWLSIVKKFNTRKRAIIFTVISFLAVVIISALIITIKSRF